MLVHGVDGALGCVGTDEAVDVPLALVAHPRLVVTIAAFGRTGEGITGISARPRWRPAG